MAGWQHRILAAAALLAALIAHVPARGEGLGQPDLDEALSIKIAADGSLRELNQVIELLERALDKGLDLENSDFAEQLLGESLLERATQIGAVIESLPASSLTDQRVQRMMEQALSDLRRVHTYDNPPAEATARLAKLLSLPGGDRDEARGFLDGLIENADLLESLSPAEQADVYALRAGLQTDAAKALDDYDRAIELATDKIKYQLARAEFRFGSDDPEAALADVAAIVAEQPDNVQAVMVQAQIQRELEQYDEALASFAKAAELAPHSPLPPQYRGEIYYDMEEYVKAVEEFSRVLRMDPTIAAALIRRSQAYFALGKMDEALADIEAVLRDNPGMALAHGLRAQALAGQRRMPEAIAEMKLLAAELPGQVDVHFQLALYYVLNEQPQEAIKAYTEAIKLDPQHYLSVRGRGDAHLSLGDHAAAIADFERALELKPEDESMLNNFAWVLATSPDDGVRDGRRAVELATKACELTDYREAYILSTLAAAYAESGDFETARKWSQAAVGMNDPDHAEQLAEELASYERNQPWRERQSADPSSPAAASGDAEAPPADEAGAQPGDADAPAAPPEP